MQLDNRTARSPCPSTTLYNRHRYHAHCYRCSIGHAVRGQTLHARCHHNTTTPRLLLCLCHPKTLIPIQQALGTMLFGSIEEEVLARSVGAQDWVTLMCAWMIDRVMALGDLQVMVAEWLLDVLYPLSEYLLLKVAALAWFLRGPLHHAYASHLR